MITLKTNDNRLKGFCDLWNAILQENRSYENVTLLNGETINDIVVQIKVPSLNLDNRSLHPQIFRKNQMTTITIPFYFPRDFESKYDMSMLLDAITWVITDTLSVYCIMNPVNRYRLEQNLHQKNEYFLESIVEGVVLSQTLSNLNDRALLMEIRLDDPLKSIPFPSIDEITIREELSHIAHKARIIGYRYIAHFGDVMTLTNISPFSFSRSEQEGGIEFIPTHLDIVYAIINKFPNGTQFFSFIKHVTSSARNLPYFPKGSLKDLNANQLSTIVQTAKIPGNFDKNKPIKTTFTQMVILNFYIVIKEHLSQNEFTKIIREERVPLKIHEKIFQSAYEDLPHRVTQQLKETLENHSDLKKFDWEKIFPSDVLLQNPDTVDRMDNTKKVKLKEKFEELSKKYGTQTAKHTIKIPGTKADFLRNILKDTGSLNTIMSYYSHIHFLDTLNKINEITLHLEKIMDNEENLSETIELLLMNISDYQNERELQDQRNNHDLDYQWNNIMPLSLKDDEKFKRIIHRISSFVNDFYNQLLSLWKREDYIDHLDNHETDDSYIKTLRDQMNQIDEIGTETGDQLIDEEMIHKFIYGLIGYYFNFHNTTEILHTIKNSKVPSLGNINLPLKESFPMTFDHSFNSFRPRSREFSKNEYKQFCSIISSLCE